MDCIGCGTRIFEDLQWVGGTPDLCGDCQRLLDPTLYVACEEIGEMPLMEGMRR